MSKDELAALNKKLKDTFGYQHDGFATYRVSWAPDQYEYRHGEHAEFTGSGILKNRFFGTKYVPKYVCVGDAYVLEKRVPIILNEVRDDSKMNYEAIIQFPKDKDPWFEAIEWFLKLGMEGPDALARETAAARLIKKEEDKYEREVRYFEEILAEGGES